MEMGRYSEERKEAILRKLLPPENIECGGGIETGRDFKGYPVCSAKSSEGRGGSSARIGKGSRRMVCGGEVGGGD